PGPLPAADRRPRDRAVRRRGPPLLEVPAGRSPAQRREPLGHAHRRDHENPYFSVISPLLSRSIVLTLDSLEREDLDSLVDRALADERGLDGAVTLTDDAREALLRLGGGDARKILTSLEAAAAAALMKDSAEIDAATLAQAVNRAAVRYDRAGDQHYDVTSAFIKSMRGSDVDAALHYLARMIEAGEDPRFIAR